MVATQAGVELEIFECNRSSGTYRSRYDTESVPASMGIIATLSKIQERCPTDLEPLQEFVDTDALDEFFRDTDETADHLSVTFPVGRHTVSVYGSGRITVTSSDVNAASQSTNGGPPE
jgi:hypothetical protein